MPMVGDGGVMLYADGGTMLGPDGGAMMSSSPVGDAGAAPGKGDAGALKGDAGAPKRRAPGAPAPGGEKP